MAKQSKQTADDIRCLSTLDNCYSAFESFTDELSMLFVYIFFCLTGVSFITCCTIGREDEWFDYALYTTLLSPFACYGTYRIYRWIEDRMESNPVAESIVFDRKRDQFRIYISDTMYLCGCWGMRNKAKMIWKCPLSALQRCEYLEEGRVIVMYYFDAEKQENDLQYFNEMYFVNEKWENDINDTLKQCKRDWKIKNRR